MPLTRFVTVPEPVSGFFTLHPTSEINITTGISLRIRVPQ